MAIPATIYLYRITHIHNLEYIIQHGKLTCPNHPDSDPNYIGIGDETLIQNRRVKLIERAPGGTFSDYVAFYFGLAHPCFTTLRTDIWVSPKAPRKK